KVNSQIQEINLLKEAGDKPLGFIQLALRIQQVAHAELISGIEERFGISWAADTQHGVVEFAALALHFLGQIKEGCSAGALLLLAQIEVRVEVENTDALSRIGSCMPQQSVSCTVG